MQGNMEVETRRQGRVKENRDSQGDIKLSISNSTRVGTLNVCKASPSGGLPGDRSGCENQNRPTGTGIPLQVASSKSCWWQVHPRQGCHWQENPVIWRGLGKGGYTIYRLLDRWPLGLIPDNSSHGLANMLSSFRITQLVSASISPIYPHQAYGVLGICSTGQSLGAT